jgi:hypothetical protein
MAKAKFDPKDFLLRRGEVLVMGISGFFLVLMLIWGVSKWSSAMDPKEKADKLTQLAESVNTKIKTGTPTAEQTQSLDLPEWLKPKPGGLAKASAADFSMGQLFDPTAAPSTKRDNPIVLPIGEFQADLVKGAMPGYDIIIVDEEGEPLIAVLTKTTESKLDEDKLKKVSGLLRDQAKLNQRNRTNLSSPVSTPAVQPANPMGNAPPGRNQPGGNPLGGGMGGFPGRGGGGGRGPMMGMGGSSPYGGRASAADQKAQRVDAVKYIPLKELDSAVRAGNLPALTVVPLRMITIHAVVPYKKQLEELKRALRLSNPPPTAKPEDLARSDAEARQWGPWYDGFEVQRKITWNRPDGTVEIIKDWPDKPNDPKDTSGNFKFEEMYIDKIDTRKVADHLDEGYLSYFLKPEMMLAMPLPQMAKDLSVKYPEIKLRDIVDNIEKLKKANQKEPTPSELLKKLTAAKPKNSIYGVKTADGLEGFGYDARKYGPAASPGGDIAPSGSGPSGPGSPKRPAGYGDNSGTPSEVDNYLLRFVDSDVTPGWNYEYRIRLRMWNPNYGQDKLVAVPEYAKDTYKVLYSKWQQLPTSIPVPAEAYLYAHDVKAYREEINTTYPIEGKESSAETRSINNLLQVKDYQAVIEIANWMPDVKAGEGAKREPVGAWVVADMPVARGEYIGRRQYVKLPLWSSESQQYTLREINDKALKGRYHPKGWLVDFTTDSILVDYEGGKVKTRSNVRFDAQGNLASQVKTLEEEVGTELLIYRADGKLVVRSSIVDDADLNRKSITSEWSKWVKQVENHKTTPEGKSGEANPFDRKQ